MNAIRLSRLSAAQSTRPPPTRFASQEEFDKDREDTFLALSISKALVDLGSCRTGDGMESQHANTLGFIPPSGPNETECEMLSDGEYLSHAVRAYTTSGCTGMDGLGGTQIANVCERTGFD